jgi:hypothetical protein
MTSDLDRNTPQDDAESAKARITVSLDGYHYWVFYELAKYRDQRPSSLANYIMQRWIDDNAEFLARFDITHERWEVEKRANLRDFPKER